MNHAHSSFRALRMAALAGVAVAGASAPGCRGDRSDEPPRQFFPDLDDQPKWSPQGGSSFFSDGRTMRPPPHGAVAFGYQPFVTEAEWGGVFMKKRADLLKEDDAYYLGMGADGKYLDKIPVPVTAALLARGQERFDIYCIACHGFAGDGKGMVGVQIQPAPATFHDPKYREPNAADPSIQLWKDGYIFHTIRNGVNPPPPAAQTMPPYRHAIDEADAWAIVAYVRVLQESRSGTIEDIPAAQRQALEEKRAALIKEIEAAAPPPAPPAPAQPGAGGKS